MALTIPVYQEYLNKKACRKEAQELLREGKIIGMSEKQLAREIYSHAVVFYYCDRTGGLPKWKEHANPIDLHDGGDAWLKRVAYAACWLLRPDKMKNQENEDNG